MKSQERFKSGCHRAWCCPIFNPFPLLFFRRSTGTEAMGS
jgi:hypothetical protein